MPPPLPPHVLVVDDEACVREAISLALSGTHVVHAAATGAAACAILRTRPIAAIVLDAVLRDEHGLDLVDAFRALSGAPILVLTGHGSEELVVRALRARVDDYLKKPVKLLELRSALARLTRRAGTPEASVARAQRRLAELPEGGHTTESLAREVGLSERHLRRQFHQAYGKTPRRYLTELRLERAVELLRGTRLGIEQIAGAVGYARVTTFDRIFKRAFRLTPSAFRQGLEALGRRQPGSPSQPPARH